MPVRRKRLFGRSGDRLAIGPALEAADRSIVDVFWRNVAERGDAPALRWREGREWSTLSWTGYGEAVRRVAGRLIDIGVGPGERVAILSGNRWEWHVADIAILSIGAATVPIYQTDAAGQVAHALAHSEARVVFVDGPAQLAKVLLRRGELPLLSYACTFDGVDGLDDDFVFCASGWLDGPPGEATGDAGSLEDRAAAIRPADLATLVYTSGTTGPPKATMLTHGNILQNLRNVTSIVPIGPEDRFLSFLPLSHIAERSVSHFGQVVSGGQTWFAQSLASVPEDIVACRPTIFFAVPRVWEKLREGVLEGLHDQRRAVRAVADRYLELSHRHHTSEMDPSPPSILERLELRALHGVFGRLIRKQVGLGEAHFLVSGAAPIARELLEWFAGIGLPIAEVYGQTEGCGVTTLNPPDAIRFGTVGPAVPNVEVRTAEDGEVLVRGSVVTPGYLNDAEATSTLLDPAGWMHTGDVGSLDEDGYLTITGRKKDLIVTSSGKNISPQEIETALRFEPLISQAIVVGDNRPYLGALLTLDPDAVNAWADAHGKFTELESLVDDAELIAEVGTSVARVNAKHARIEGIKRWRVLPRDLTVADGELTPTMKVKREAVTTRFERLIEEMYAER